MENYRYIGYTLVDITKTDITTYDKELEKQRNQQRNWETIEQILSLRSKLIEFNYRGVNLEELAEHHFGVNYTGKHNVWSFDFIVDKESVYADGHDRYGALKEDFKTTPIILGLDETIKPTLALFYPSGIARNIYFITTTDK